MKAQVNPHQARGGDLSEFDLWQIFNKISIIEISTIKKRLSIGCYQLIMKCPDCENTMGFPPTGERGLKYCNDCDKKFAWLELRGLAESRWVECICPKCGEKEKFFFQRSGLFHCQECDSVAGLARCPTGRFAIIGHPENIKTSNKKSLADMFCMEGAECES